VKKGPRFVSEYGTGLIEPRPEDRVDKESEEYFRRLSQDYAEVPDNYSAVEKGVFTSQSTNELTVVSSAISFIG